MNQYCTPPNWRNEIITAAELAERLGCSERTITRRCDRGEIPASRLLGKYLIPAGALLKLLEEDALAKLRQSEPVDSSGSSSFRLAR